MTIGLMSVQERIRGYISQNILFSDGEYPYSDEASFIEEAIIDSLGMMDLVLFVEQELGVAVADEDVTPDNFGSVSKLASYVQRRGGDLGL
jgi:acyl carrier protein